MAVYQLPGSCGGSEWGVEAQLQAQVLARLCVSSGSQSVCERATSAGTAAAPVLWCCSLSD